MPPRHAYWTILVDNQPTAFRAHEPEELLPTLNRLREKNDTAVMKWFERGQLFDSREAAKDAGLGKGERRWEGPRPERRDDRDDRYDRRDSDRSSGARDSERSPGGRDSERSPGGRDFPARRSFSEGGSRAARDDRGPRDDRPRDKNWRPGGEHRDPRQKYKDAKKAKWGRFKQKIRDRHEERMARDPETFTPPHGDKLRARPQWNERREDNRGGDNRREDNRRGDNRREDWREDTRRADRGPREERPSRPHGDKFRDQRPKGPARGSFSEGGRDRDERPAWRHREDRPASRSREDRPKWPARDRDDRPSPSNREERPKWPARRNFGEGGRDRDERPGGGFKKKPFGAPRSGDSSYRDSRGTKPSGGPGRRSFSEGGPGRRSSSEGGPGHRSLSEGGRKPWGSKPGGSSRPPGGSSRPRGPASRPPTGGFNRKPAGPRRRRDEDE